MRGSAGANEEHEVGANKEHGYRNGYDVRTQSESESRSGSGSVAPNADIASQDSNQAKASDSTRSGKPGNASHGGAAVVIARTSHMASDSDSASALARQLQGTSMRGNEMPISKVPHVPERTSQPPVEQRCGDGSGDGHSDGLGDSGATADDASIA